MAHADDLLKYITDASERAKVTKYFDDYNPQRMPKLLQCSMSAVVVDYGLGTDWTRVSGKFKNDWPVKCRIVNFGGILDSAESLKVAHTMKNDLLKMGVKSFVHIHQGCAAADNNSLVTDNILCIPTHSYSEFSKEDSSRSLIPDFDSAVAFYAYLLHKNLISEKDISFEDRRVLDFAKSIEAQNKIRAALGEPLFEGGGTKRGRSMVFCIQRESSAHVKGAIMT